MEVAYLEGSGLQFFKNFLKIFVKEFRSRLERRQKSEWNCSLACWCCRELSERNETCAYFVASANPRHMQNHESSSFFIHQDECVKIFMFMFLSHELLTKQYCYYSNSTNFLKTERYGRVQINDKNINGNINYNLFTICLPAQLGLSYDKFSF